MKKRITNPTMLTIVRVHVLALVRILRARWTTRRLRTDGALHLVPLDDVKDGHMGLPITKRPTLCKVFVTHSGGGTIQPDIVTCWPCAVAHERSVMGPRAARD